MYRINSVVLVEFVNLSLSIFKNFEKSLNTKKITMRIHCLQRDVFRKKVVLKSAATKMLSRLSTIMLIIYTYCKGLKSESRIQKELRKRKLKSCKKPITENSI